MTLVFHIQLHLFPDFPLSVLLWITACEVAYNNFRSSNVQLYRVSRALSFTVLFNSGLAAVSLPLLKFRTQFISPSLSLSPPVLFSFFFRGDLERERDRRDFRLSFSNSFACDRVLFGDLSSFVESSVSPSGSICSLSVFSCLGFFSSFFPSLSKIWSKDRGMCAR